MRVGKERMVCDLAESVSNAVVVRSALELRQSGFKLLPRRQAFLRQKRQANQNASISRVSANSVTKQLNLDANTPPFLHAPGPPKSASHLVIGSPQSWALTPTQCSRCGRWSTRVAQRHRSRSAPRTNWWRAFLPRYAQTPHPHCSRGRTGDRCCPHSMRSGQPPLPLPRRRRQ